MKWWLLGAVAFGGFVLGLLTRVAVGWWERKHFRAAFTPQPEHGHMAAPDLEQMRERVRRYDFDGEGGSDDAA